MNKLLPTSTAGSLPNPSWLAQPETLWSPWKLQDQELTDGKQDALRLSLHEQQQAGIDIVSDGEQSRQHFVTTFIEHLDGVDFQKRETVRIRNRYDASVPTVVGAVSRQKPVFVEDAKFLRQQTNQPIKWALPGPMTMIDTLYDAHYKSREKLAFELLNAVVPPDAITVQIGAPDVIVMLPVGVAWLVPTVQVLLELNCDPVKLAVIVVPAIIPIPFRTAPSTIPLPLGVFVTVNVVPVILPVKLVLVLPNVSADHARLLTARDVQLIPSGLLAADPDPVTLVHAPVLYPVIVNTGLNVELVLTVI